jgi:hypothetical protein
LEGNWVSEVGIEEGYGVLEWMPGQYRDITEEEKEGPYHVARSTP